MHAIYEFTDYKEFLKAFIKPRGFTYAAIADCANVQKPYVSAVLNGHNHFNEEQLYEIGFLLELRNDELDYLLLLLRENKTQPGRRLKERLRQKIKEEQNKKQRMTERLASTVPIVDHDLSVSIRQYYLDPELQRLHMYLLIPRYQRNSELLATAVGFSVEEVERRIDSLVRIGIIKRSGAKCTPTNHFLHLDKESLISQHNHLLWRMHAVQEVPRRKGSHQFTGSICASTEAKEKLKNELQKLISRFYKDIENEPNESVFQLNVDLYSL